MNELVVLTKMLKARKGLSDAEVALAAEALATPGHEAGDEEKAEFLEALGDKGETAEEIAAFARYFRAKAMEPGEGVTRWSAEAIDVVGTGGDHAGGFNISSLVVLTLASAGVKVMKHGNRGITSKCGSADLLAGLGVKLEATPEQLGRGLDELGYAFFFAPGFHPAFKHIAPVRKVLAGRGRRSVFNILGPLINPGRPARMLMGVFAEPWVERMAAVLELLGTESGLVAHGRLGVERGIDELTTATPNRVRGVGRLATVDGVWTAEDYGLETAPFADLVGGDLETNLALVEALLAGRGPKGLVDTVVWNAAVGLFICGRHARVEDGIGEARDRLLGGGVKAKIAATREFYGV